MTLPSHTTHYLQPLDRAVFKSLKVVFYNACQAQMKKKAPRVKLNVYYLKRYIMKHEQEQQHQRMQYLQLNPLEFTLMMQMLFLIMNTYLRPEETTDIETNLQKSELSKETKISVSFLDNSLPGSSWEYVEP